MCSALWRICERLIDERALSDQKRVQGVRLQSQLRRAAPRPRPRRGRPHDVEGDGDRLPRAFHASPDDVNGYCARLLFADSRSMQPLVSVYW